MTRTLLAVDLSNHVYKAAAAHPMLTSRRIFTGGLYGFFTTFAKIVRETRATHVAFCQDVKPYKRSETYPEYKQLSRKKNRDEDLLRLYKQSMELILEVMAACGLQPWGIPGFEADDLIGHCVMKYRHRFDRIYAATNDSDPFQLLWCDNFYLYRKELKDVVTGDKLVDPFGRPITPDQYMLATALMGTHNDIDGIPRVGAGTAFKALHDPALMRKLRDGHSDLIERNLRLIKLPHEAFPREASLPTHQSFNPRTLYRALGKYDIEVTGAVERAFQELFGR